MSPIYFCKWKKCQYNPEGEKYHYSPEGGKCQYSPEGAKMPVQSRGAGLGLGALVAEPPSLVSLQGWEDPTFPGWTQIPKICCCGLISQCIKPIKEVICTSWKVFNIAGVWILAAVPWLLPHFQVPQQQLLVLAASVFPTLHCWRIFLSHIIS